ncbi:hypothetical protein [Streptomonospora wellingtoniae]|uniref:Type IV toxin-antitoxin system AbiEi family antitoxin domain-containing protein n=1 Tax=Streptomonospora wellingtoniae TaxID=3075544 RepID=A0ABU2KQ93_9ACTN|nr:hypothetical protein [Streptomonospora sp. DSM 45055]MDT0301428.1 hypothetical protein [Streptomonospora sp. DSM 45055]
MSVPPAPNLPAALPPPAHRAAALAARQYGSITWHQALDCGIDDGLVRRLLRSGHWVKVYPRVYAVRSAVEGAEEDQRLLQRVMAAQLALGPAGFAGGATAARLWGMQGFPPWDGREMHMVIPALGAQRHVRGITLHSWDTADEEITTVGSGIRLTTPGRTLRDVLLHVDRDTGVSLIDSALNRGLVRRTDLPSLHAANRGRRGCRRVGEWWRSADDRAQSPLETRIRLVCADGGLPPSALQHPFTDARGRVFAVADLWWEELQVIGECDGLGPHGQARTLAYDRKRQNALQAHYPGTRIVRFTWEDIYKPAYVLAAVAGTDRR